MEVGQSGRCGDHVTVLVAPGPHFVIENVTIPNLHMGASPVRARERNLRNVTPYHAQVIGTVWFSPSVCLACLFFI